MCVWNRLNWCLYTHVHSNIIHNNQKVEAIQVSIDRWLGKENVVHIYNGILFRVQKEGNFDTCFNINCKDIMLTK